MFFIRAQKSVSSHSQESTKLLGASWISGWEVAGFSFDLILFAKPPLSGTYSEAVLLAKQASNTFLPSFSYLT